MASKKKKSRHPVSPKGVLLIVFLELFKVSKMTNFNYDLFKSSKMTNLNYHHKNHPATNISVFFKIGFFLALMCMYIFLWFFFMVKNCYKFSKMGIQGNG